MTTTERERRQLEDGNNIITFFGARGGVAVLRLCSGIVWRWLYFLGIKMGRGFANQDFVRHFPRHFYREMVNADYDFSVVSHLVVYLILGSSGIDSTVLRAGAC